jgi:hypothetical protein
MAEGDRIAVVDVPDRGANDVGLEFGGRTPGGFDRVGREAQIQKADVMPGGIER